MGCTAEAFTPEERTALGDCLMTLLKYMRPGRPRALAEVAEVVAQWSVSKASRGDTGYESA